MQMFISSVLSALETLLKGLAWLLREVIFIIFGRGESPPPPPHPSTKYPSAQGSIYHLYPPPPPHPSTKYSQSPSAHQSSSQQQGSTYHLYPPPPPHPSTKYSQSPSAHQSPLQQQGSTYRLYPPPPSHPATRCSQSSSAHQSPSQQQGSGYHLYPPPPPHPSTKYSQYSSAHLPQYIPYRPYRQQSVQFPAQLTPPVSPDVAPVTEPLRSYIPQDTPFQLYRQQSIHFPAQPTPPVSLDIAAVTEPIRSDTPQACLLTSSKYSQPPSAHQSPPQDTPFQPYRQQSIQFPAQPTLPVSLDVTAVTEPIRSDTPQACLLTSSKYSQPPSAHRSPSQYTPFQPYCQQSVQFPAQLSPPVSPDVALVIEPVQSDTPQPYCQQSVQFPAQLSPPVSPDAAAVTEPVQSDIPQQSRRFSGPELVTRAPEVVVTPIVIDPYEDPGSLRLKARSEGSRMEECFKQSREAFARNERGLAKQLSLRGEAYKANMVRLDKEASTKIFQEHNQRHRSNTIDLHGLFVSEAKVYFDDAVQEVRDRGESLLRVIVGRGNHSENNIARIKPAIQEYGQSLGLGIEVDPLNNGCLVVSLDPS